MSRGLMAQFHDWALRHHGHLAPASVLLKYSSSLSRGLAQPSLAITERPKLNYRVFVIAPGGQICTTRRLCSENDDEAAHAAAMISDEYAVDLWDGLRFIEHFELRDVSTT